MLLYFGGAFIIRRVFIYYAEGCIWMRKHGNRKQVARADSNSNSLVVTDDISIKVEARGYKCAFCITNMKI